MDGPVSVGGVLLSTVLILTTVGLSLYWSLGVSRQVVVAAARAAIQLLAAGAIFHLIIESTRPGWLVAAWLAAMIAVGATVVSRRVGGTGLRSWLLAMLATALPAGLSLTTVFGLGVIEPEPLSIVVIGGITIGNSVPAAALAGNRLQDFTNDRRRELEAVLSLGFDRPQVVRFVVPAVVRLALIPQIETTRVVGLIALPGAMTGLLLAGVDPVDAVLAQIVVMYLVLGTVCVSAITVSIGGAYDLLTDDLRVVAPRRD